MNFLAHFYLSRHTPSMIIGSFLGDFVKGNQYQQYDEDIARAILLHREIDHYTDHHPEFLKSKHRLQPSHNHYSGVVVDIFYDHLLAQQWSSYYSQPLKSFSDTVYHALEARRSLMPAKAQQVLYYMVRHNWLVNYAFPEGISRTLNGMEQRSRYPNQMGSALSDLHDHYPDFAREFSLFFPDMQRHVDEWWGN